MDKSVNKENVLALMSFIAGHKELSFDMNLPNVPTSCGSAGCIGGFAGALWPDIQTPRTEGLMPGERGTTWSPFYLQEKLGIDEDIHQQLCYPSSVDMKWADNGDDERLYVEYDEITRHGALKTLQRLAHTGVVEWRKDEQV